MTEDGEAMEFDKQTYKATEKQELRKFSASMKKEKLRKKANIRRKKHELENVQVECKSEVA